MNLSLPSWFKSESHRVFLALVIFLGVTGFSTFHHEMWRDELEAWLIVRDSTFSEMLNVIRYTGHPPLWYVLLFPLSRLFAPASMQVLHWAIAGASAFLFFAFAPFKWREKILVGFGYYLSYEYAVISREYVLSVFFIFLACGLIPERRRRLWVLVLVLFFLAASSICGFVISLAMAGTVGFDLIKNRSAKPFFPALFLVAGWFLLLWQLRLPADAGWRVETKPWSSFSLTLDYYAKALLHLPRPGAKFWDNPIIHGNLAVVAVFFFGALGFFLRKSPLAFLFYVLSSLGLSLFFHVVFHPGTRHLGFFLVALVAAIWIYRRSVSDLGKMNFFWNLVWYTTLAIQFTGAVIAHTMDGRYAFSRGKAAFQFLQKNGLAEKTLIVEPSYAASSLIAYGHMKTYLPFEGVYRTYPLWNRRPKGEGSLSSPADFERIWWRIEPLKADLLFVSVHEFNPEITRNHLKLMAYFAGSVTGEDFYIYEFK